MAAVEDVPPPTQVYLVNFENYLRPKQPSKCQPLQRFARPVGRVSRITKSLRRLKLLRWYNEASKRFGQLPLPKFLEFLRARNDDGLCKRKTGFEIYCEMASIHGFHIFVGAKTWQRILWWLLICTAVLLSLIIVTMGLSMNKERHTSRFIRTMLKPSAEVPFPAITICGFDKFSRQSLQTKAMDWGVSDDMLWELDPSTLEKLANKNISWLSMLQELIPPICPEVIKCEWDNRLKSCPEKVKESWTLDLRRCCSFNYQQRIFSSHLGVTLALQPKDRHTPGYQVLLHKPFEIPTHATPRLLIPSGSETHILVRPFANQITTNLESIPVLKRGCYLPEERRLFSFSTYNQVNCLAECRSEGIFKSCGCIPPHAPGQSDWKVCDLKQMGCVKDYESNELIKEQTNCNCLPPCQFNRYEFQSDIRFLNVTNSLRGGNSSITTRPQNVLLRVYFDSPVAEELVLDVHENWLTFIGTFGGITGLFMGCSFVSVFELIFFACVRPTCNWLTRQQIIWRRRRRQRVGQADGVGH